MKLKKLFAGIGLSLILSNVAADDLLVSKSNGFLDLFSHSSLSHPNDDESVGSQSAPVLDVSSESSGVSNLLGIFSQAKESPLLSEYKDVYKLNASVSSISAGYGVLPLTPLHKYFSHIISRINKAHSNIDIHFNIDVSLNNSPSYITPEGNLVVSISDIKSLKSEDEVALYLATAMASVILGDVESPSEIFNVPVSTRDDYLDSRMASVMGSMIDLIEDEEIGSGLVVNESTLKLGVDLMQAAGFKPSATKNYLINMYGEEVSKDVSSYINKFYSSLGDVSSPSEDYNFVMSSSVTKSALKSIDLFHKALWHRSRGEVSDFDISISKAIDITRSKIPGYIAVKGVSACEDQNSSFSCGGVAEYLFTLDSAPLFASLLKSKAFFKEKDSERGYSALAEFASKLDSNSKREKAFAVILSSFDLDTVEKERVEKICTQSVENKGVCTGNRFLSLFNF